MNGIKEFTKCVPLGQVGISANANMVLTEYDVRTALNRHILGDWGDASNNDWKSNDRALKNDERIISSYTGIYGDKFWIITEADRAYTTVMIPDARPAIVATAVGQGVVESTLVIHAATTIWIVTAGIPARRTSGF